MRKDDGDRQGQQFLAPVLEQVTGASVDVQGLVQVRVDQKDGIVGVLEDLAEQQVVACIHRLRVNGRAHTFRRPALQLGDLLLQVRN